MRLCLARHAVRGVHRGAKDVAVLKHDGAEVAANPDRHGLAVDLELRMSGNLLLHLRCSVERVVRGGEGRHDLITHRLDHRPLALLGRTSHHIDADGDHVPRAQVAHQLIEPGGADHVGKQYGEFYIFAHVIQANGKRRSLIIRERPIAASCLIELIKLPGAPVAALRQSAGICACAQPLSAVTQSKPEAGLFRNA